MTWSYNRKLDRWIDLRPGLAGHGMHQFVMDEVELGGLVALGLNHEAAWGAVEVIMEMQHFPRLGGW